MEAALVMAVVMAVAADAAACHLEQLEGTMAVAATVVAVAMEVEVEETAVVAMAKVDAAAVVKAATGTEAATGAAVDAAACHLEQLEGTMAVAATVVAVAMEVEVEETAVVAMAKVDAAAVVKAVGAGAGVKEQRTWPQTQSRLSPTEQLLPPLESDLQSTAGPKAQMQPPPMRHLA